MLRSLLPAHLFAPTMGWSLAPLALIIVWLISGAGHRDRRPWLLVCAYAGSAWIAVALPGYFFGHYYQLLLPPFCIAGGWSTEALLRQPQRWPALPRWFCVGLIFSVTLCWESTNLRLTSEEWSREKYPAGDVPEQKALGIRLRTLLLPSEHVWELGEENEIYFESGKSPPSGLLYLEPIASGPERRIYAGRMLTELKQATPDLIIINQHWAKAFPPDSGLLPWIESAYLRAQQLDQGFYKMYVRRDSALARRLKQF